VVIGVARLGATSAIPDSSTWRARMTGGFVLLLNRDLAFGHTHCRCAGNRAGIRKLDVAVAPAIAFHVIDKAAEPNEGLFHLLMSIEPFLFARADIATQQSASFFAAS